MSFNLKNLYCRLRSREVIFPGILLLCTCLVYSNILSNGFAGDDLDFIINWDLTKNLGHIFSLVSGSLPQHHEGVFRPVRSLFYLFAQQLWGTQPVYYHLFSLIIHSCSTLLVYSIVKKITKNGAIALTVGLLFSLHPIHTESISYATSSFDTIGSSLFFASFLLYLRYLEAQVSLKKKYYILSLIIALLAFFTNEMTLTLPILITLYIVSFPDSKIRFTNKIKEIIPYYGLVLCFIMLRFGIVATPLRGSYQADSFALTMLVSLKVIVQYLKLLVVPVNLSLDHTIPFNISTFSLAQFNDAAIRNQTLLQAPSLIALFIIVSLLTASYICRKRYPVISFSIVWFFIALLPVLNIIPNYTLMLEAYLYIASFGFCLLLGWGLWTFFKKPSWLVFTLLSIICLFYSYQTHTRNKDWFNEVTLWESAAGLSPENGLVLYKLGSAYNLADRNDEAIAAYEKALSVNNTLPFVNHNLGIIYLQRNELDKAARQFETAIALNPDSFQSHYDLGVVYSKTDNLEKAAEQFEESLPFNYKTDDVSRRLADIYNELGLRRAQEADFETAAAYFGKALSYFPDTPVTFTNLGTLHAQQKDYMKAIHYYQKALEADANYFPARDNLIQAQRLLQKNQ